jgi:hypothetical protein
MKFAISSTAIITEYFKYTTSSKHLVIKSANYNLGRVSFSYVNKAVRVAIKREIDQPTTKYLRNSIRYINEECYGLDLLNYSYLG